MIVNPWFAPPALSMMIAWLSDEYPTRHPHIMSL
jgi:hypothetical protein